MNNTHYHNGVRYILVASTRDFRDREPKSIIEAMAPVVGEMDKNYLKLRALMDKADNNDR